MLTDKVVCKKCKKEITSMKEVGFLLLMTDSDVCPQCEMEICGTDDHFDKYCTEHSDKQGEDRLLVMPCFRCVRTAIHCKKCGSNIIRHEIKQKLFTAMSFWQKVKFFMSLLFAKD